MARVCFEFIVKNKLLFVIIFKCLLCYIYDGFFLNLVTKNKLRHFYFMVYLTFIIYLLIYFSQRCSLRGFYNIFRLT